MKDEIDGQSGTMEMESWQMEMESYFDILHAFFASDDFLPAVVASTKASWRSGMYKVELFPDGAWRVLWSGHIGNRYETPGHILGIPQLENDEDGGDDEALLAQADIEANDIRQIMIDDLRDRYSGGKQYNKPARSTVAH